MTEGNTRRGAMVLLDRILLRWLAMPGVVRWCAPTIIVAALWWSSSQTPKPSEPSTVGALLHNSMHVVAYASLGGAAWLAIRGKRIDHPTMVSAVAMLIAVLYGVVDELHQSYVPDRVCSFADLLSDTSGALVAVTWLRSRVDRVAVAAIVPLGLAVACVASVCLATFGPW